jgi:hypothetical protein
MVIRDERIDEEPLAVRQAEVVRCQSGEALQTPGEIVAEVADSAAEKWGEPGVARERNSPEGLTELTEGGGLKVKERF